MNKDRILIVIPARLDSTRLPQKLLEEIHGKPIIIWTAERALNAGYHNLVVAADDQKIVAACERHSIPVTLTSKSCLNGTERVFEVSKKYQNVDFFVNVQGDEPRLNTKLLDAMFELDADEAFYTSISLIKSKNFNPSEVKVALGLDNRIRYASRSEVPFYREQQHDKRRFKIHGVYLYSRHVLELFSNSKPGPLEVAESVEQLRCIEHDIPLFGVKTEGTDISVDTYDDLAYMRSMPYENFIA